MEVYFGTLKSVRVSYKTQKMCDQAANTHSSTIGYGSECCKTQDMGVKALNKYFRAFICIPGQCKL